MLCKHPVHAVGGTLVPCNRCPTCRINRRRIWAHRIVLEAMQYKDNAFVTLTYADEAITRTSGSDLPTLVPDDVQKWLKRFRKKIQPHTIRYFLVGEYGEDTSRPHYHVALFGWPPCHYGISRYRHGYTKCCVPCDTVRDTWGLGHVELGQISLKSANYIAGYVTKKLTDWWDERLNGRQPEFARMSRNPGIGVSALWDVADVLMRYNEVSWDDVPVHLRHGRKLVPLGRFMRGKLRLMVGYDNVNVPKEAQIKKSKEMLPMRLSARENAEKSLKEIVVEVNKGAVANMEAKAELYSRKRGKI